MSEILNTNKKLCEAMHLQAIEGNPLDAKDIAMFEMFEREGYTPDQRRAHILAQVDVMVPAAE